MNHVLHYVASLGAHVNVGWIAMVDTLGMPTIFLLTVLQIFTGQIELALLFATEYNGLYSQEIAVIENLALADWFFYYQVQQFIETLFYVGILETTNYWHRFERQHRAVHILMVLHG